jgi:hypothetical protein
VRLAGIHIPPNPSFQKRNQTQAGFRIPLSGSRFLFRHILFEITEQYSCIFHDLFWSTGHGGY